ncbi:hypothetical protein KO494_05940 [Lacinutrix sp. C3R15]|uniref:hypothetical protein n=1 Tax=Flavobacteriaceae TaxID=49546 RepID=UPI001C09029B|nr:MULTISPECIES: hypothetical protein [Flavobacteriaceae]MBU2939078.1 hypothetical protein [Lacinutrix sp. C3R15]MDO6622393.1 hypothetical protein [Oceanihabitans sp. 1_MG-2023]
MKSLKITLLVAVVCAIFASLTPQQNPTEEKDKNDQTIVKVTFKKEKKGIKIPQQG